MTQTYIKLVRDAISSIIGGFAEEVAVLQVLQRNIEVDLSDSFGYSIFFRLFSEWGDGPRGFNRRGCRGLRRLRPLAAIA